VAASVVLAILCIAALIDRLNPELSADMEVAGSPGVEDECEPPDDSLLPYLSSALGDSPEPVCLSGPGELVPVSGDVTALSDEVLWLELYIPPQGETSVALWYYTPVFNDPDSKKWRASVQVGAKEDAEPKYYEIRVLACEAGPSDQVADAYLQPNSTEKGQYRWGNQCALLKSSLVQALV
jgi:hypothetical protein